MIQDQFSPVVRRKLADYGLQSCRYEINASDQVDRVSFKAIRTFLAEGADLITVTGGMSVDLMMLHQRGGGATGGRVVTYGVPMLPGAMFMLA